MLKIWDTCWPVVDVTGVVGVIVAVTGVEEADMFVVIEESVVKVGGSVSVRWIKIKFYHLSSWNLDYKGVKQQSNGVQC